MNDAIPRPVLADFQLFGALVFRTLASVDLLPVFSTRTISVPCSGAGILSVWSIGAEGVDSANLLDQPASCPRSVSGCLSDDGGITAGVPQTVCQLQQRPSRQPGPSGHRCASLVRLIDDRAAARATPPKASQAIITWLITSSAWFSNKAGMLMPSASAVLRLITNWNFVGCSTGSSPGLSP